MLTPLGSEQTTSLLVVLIALPQDALDQQVAPQGHPGPGEEGGQDAGHPRGGVPPGEGLGEEEGQGIRPDDQAGEDAVNQTDPPMRKNSGARVRKEVAVWSSTCRIRRRSSTAWVRVLGGSFIVNSPFRITL